MRIAALASPVGSVVVAGAMLGAVATRQHTPEPQPQAVAEQPPAIVVPDVPGNARYWSIDLDGDGTPELFAETRDHGMAVIVQGTKQLATIPLRFAGNPCDSELGIEGDHLVAHDYGGSSCEETATRRFRIRDGQLATVTVWDTKIVIVDN
jgi:hypothetical protein